LTVLMPERFQRNADLKDITFYKLTNTNYMYYNRGSPPYCFCVPLKEHKKFNLPPNGIFI
jgi:hypothetical protein